MITIGFPGKKGGPGKTTCSQLACLGAEEHGYKSVLVRLEGTVDYDRPFTILNATEQHGINQHEQWKSTLNEIRGMKGLGLCVFDSAANAINYDREIISKSDLCLIPTMLDQQSFDYARKSIEIARELDVPVFILPNQCNMSYSDIKELEANFSSDEILHYGEKSENYGRYFRIPRLNAVRRLCSLTPMTAAERRQVSQIAADLWDAINYSTKRYGGV